MSDYEDYEEGEYEGYGDEDEGEGEEEVRYLPGVKAGEYASGGPILITGKAQSPMERFRIQVDAIYNNLKTRGLDLTKSDLETMIGKVHKIKNIEYKNATAYVLGFIASNRGKNIDINKLKQTFNVIKFLPEGGVERPDIIRYAKFWISFKD